MTGLFITSSGTGIGKTYLTQALLLHDSQQRGVLTASKPIISGWPVDELEIPHTDTGRLLNAQGRDCHPMAIQEISPWRFKEPLSPNLAARMQGSELDLEDLLVFSRRQLTDAQLNSRLHLMEGVGGVMVPLNSSHTVLDWLTLLAIPSILVVGTYLGSLSHTLTALHVLRSQQLPIAALVVNETPASTVSLDQTVQSLQPLIRDLPIFMLPFQMTGVPIAIHDLYTHLLKHYFYQTLSEKPRRLGRGWIARRQRRDSSVS